MLITVFIANNWCLTKTTHALVKFKSVLIKITHLVLEISITLQRAFFFVPAFALFLEFYEVHA